MSEKTKKTNQIRMRGFVLIVVCPVRLFLFKVIKNVFAVIRIKNLVTRVGRFFVDSHMNWGF